MQLQEESFNDYYKTLLDRIEILATSAVTEDFKAAVSKNPDVIIWLGKMGFSTRPTYLFSLCYFLRCVKISNPTELLDLKIHQDVKQRFFPAERLVELWQSRLAQKKDKKVSREKRVLDAVRSFFKHNRVPLIQIQCTYKPKPKDPVSDDELRKFRETLNWRDTIIFDFLLSVPLRDGQFQVCPNCRRDFHPKWKNILTFPIIAPYSPFKITPQKGHENAKYPEGLMQVCFLTKTAAKGLNMYRDLKEKELGRTLKPEDYIFTYTKNIRDGTKHVTPIRKTTVQDIFKTAQHRVGIRIYPHLIRAWVNTRLASCGIDKQLRDIYLGHVGIQSREEGYIMQMLPKWEETFRNTNAIESLDIILGVISPTDLKKKLIQIDEQRKQIEDQSTEIETLKGELSILSVNEEQMENLKWLLQQLKEGNLIMRPPSKEPERE